MAEKLLAIAEKIKGARRYTASLAALLALVLTLIGRTVDESAVVGSLGGVLDAVSAGLVAVAGVMAFWSKRSPDSPPA